MDITIRLRISRVINAGKNDFYKSLRQTLNLSRRIANMVLTHCATDDPAMSNPVSEKIAKAGKLYAYPHIKALNRGGYAIELSSLARRYEKVYKDARFAIWRGTKQLPLVRSAPWPLLHNKSTRRFSLRETDDGRLVMTLSLRSDKFEVELKRGSNYRDQVSGVIDAMKRDAIGDSSIWIDRNGRASIGFSVDVEPEKPRVARGTLRASTSRDAFLVAMKERDTTPWTINADQMRRWQREKEKRYQRLRQDRKADVKLGRPANQELQQVAGKYNRRMQTFAHNAARALVDYAIRRRVAKLTLDATVKSYVKKFPWHDFATKVAYKCEMAGIEFSEITQTVLDPSTDKPHVYFKYSPMTNRVKIGRTGVGAARHKQAETDSPDDQLTILALDNQPRNKLVAREKYWHAYFSSAKSDKIKQREWYEAEPIITWLREAEWLGNSGNRSQIAQVLGTSEDGVLSGPPPGPR